MKKNNKKIIITIFVFFTILLLSISIIIANNSIYKDNFNIDKEKIYYEIKYFDSQIIYICNSLNNIDNTNNFYINWNDLEKQANTLYNYWNSVILDLNYLDIDKKYLINFSKKIDEFNISIKDNNKKSALICLIELYNNLIIYSEAIEYKNYTQILRTKYNLLCAYSIAESGNWTLAHEYILKASKNISKVVNSMDINKHQQYNVNQTYVAVKELENIVNIKTLNIFYLKYNLAITKLENLTLE